MAESRDLQGDLGVAVFETERNVRGGGKGIEGNKETWKREDGLSKK